jgi:hypothetical protein
MSAPKQLAKRQKLARKRQRKQEARRRRQRKQDLRGGPRDLDFGSPMFFGPPGGVKMSDLLQELVEPYAADTEGLEEYKKLLSLGVLAWNIALGPSARDTALIDEGIDRGLGTGNPEARAIARQLIEELIERKRRHFAGFRRPILDFILQDVGDGRCHLSVISAVV